jgi:choline dehydrogenase-like flavoprotein
MYPAKQPPLPPLPMGLVGETVARGFNKLGWHWWPSDSAIISQPYQGRDKCVNLGPCTSGCAQGGKSSTDITYWPEAIRRGVELRTRCRVREITVNEQGFANGVVYYDATGEECFQRAEVVVMACNGVGTPRILLNSKSAQFPDGLANRSGLVGKNLMFHPIAFVQGLFDERLDSHKGPQRVLHPEQAVLARPTRLAASCAATTCRSLADRAHWALQWPAASAARFRGVRHHEAFRQRFDHVASIGILCEDLPEEQQHRDARSHARRFELASRRRRSRTATATTV